MQLGRDSKESKRSDRAFRLRSLTVAWVWVFGIVCVFVPIATPAVWAQDGEKVVQDLVKVFGAANARQADSGVHSEAAKYIDYQLMSQLALGQSRWRGLSKTQKGDFVGDFRQLIEERYYPRWRRIFANGALSYLGETASSDRVLVKTQLKTADSSQIITWTVDRSSGSAKVINLQVGKKDLIKRAAARFEKRLSRGTFADFLAWLKKEGLSNASASSDENGKENPAS